MENITLDNTLTELAKIKDLGERMLFWRDFKRSFDKLSPEDQKAYKQESEAKARELLIETYTLLGKEMPVLP
jgi:hypothetical protein